MAERRVDAVFEGGGVKGIGLVGAVDATEEQGYQFENVAGTSAGAIVAALVAAGYRSAELRQIMQALDYQTFLDRTLVDRIPLLGPVLSILFEHGIYEGTRLETWLRELLAARGVHTFGDLVSELPGCADDPRWRYRLQVIATDLTRGRLVILPRDAALYDLDPDALDVARAVRMSMSLPFFFEPVVLRVQETPHYFVDGGVLSNFPVWLFDDEAEPAWPTFGYKLVEPREGQPRTIDGPIDLVRALVVTMLEAHDARYLDDASFVRTMGIPTLGVRTAEFDLSPDRAEALYASGRQAALEFFATWDFEAYKATYRRGEGPSRRERVRVRDRAPLPPVAAAGG